MSPGQQRTSDIRGNPLFVPQGFVLYQLRWGQDNPANAPVSNDLEFSLGFTDGPNNQFLDRATLTFPPAEPTRGNLARFDAVFGEDNPRQAGRNLVLTNTGVNTFTTNFDTLHVLLFMRGYLRH